MNIRNGITLQVLTVIVEFKVQCCVIISFSCCSFNQVVHAGCGGESVSGGNGDDEESEGR